MMSKCFYFSLDTYIFSVSIITDYVFILPFSLCNIFSWSRNRKLSWLNCFLLSHLPLQNVYSKISVYAIISRTEPLYVFHSFSFRVLLCLILRRLNTGLEAVQVLYKSLGHRKKIHAFRLSYNTTYRFKKSW